MRKYLLIIFIFLIFPKLCIAKTTFTLATGGKKGTYFALGQGIKKAIEKENPDIEIIVISTKGSIENAKLLDAGTAHLALIQNDIAYYFTKGKRMFEFPSNQMKGVASLYTEIIQIITRKELNIKRIEDLKGKIVSVGPEKSGTEFNSAVILKISGITYKDIDQKFLSFNAAMDSLLNGTIDAGFVTAGIPTPAINEIAKKVKFLPVETEIVKELRKTYPYFVSTIIPSRSYQEQYREIPAIGVRALLVVRRDLKPNIVKRIADAIFNEPEILKTAHPVASNISLRTSMKGMTIPLHLGAKKYYTTQKLIKPRLVGYLSRILSILIIILVLAFIVKYRYLVNKAIEKNIYLKLVLTFIILFIIGTTGMYFFEGEINENFTTFGESCWSGIVYLLSGFEEREPITTGGRIFSIVILFASIFVIGSVAGNFAAVFIKKGVIRMPKDVDKHIVVCNWHNGGDKIIKEIHSPAAGETEREIVVITNKTVNEEELRKDKEYEKVFFVNSDPTLHSVLKAARVHLAKSVIILANDESPDPDADSALITLAIAKGICKNSSKPHIIAEVINHRKIEHLKDAGVDEYVCAGDYGLGIIAQCALTERVSNIYQRLLSYSGDTNELYIVEDDKLPKTSEGKCIVVGKSFPEIADLFNKTRNTANPVILIGVCRDDEIILNPRKEKFEKFEGGDKLIVMAYEKPDFSKLAK